MTRAKAGTLFTLCCGLAGLGGCGREERPASSEPAVLVIEDPRPVVVSGLDTTRVFAPTIFAYAGVDASQPPPGATEAQRMVAFQRESQAARETLRAQGVRFLMVDQPLRITELPPDAPGARVDGTFTGTYGYLLIDAPGHVRKVDGPMDAGSLVCAAASTFELSVAGC